MGLSAGELIRGQSFALVIRWAYLRGGGLYAGGGGGLMCGTLRYSNNCSKVLKNEKLDRTLFLKKAYPQN